MQSLKTDILILGDDGISERRAVTLACEGGVPTYDAIKGIVLPILRRGAPDAELEHVSVLHRGRRADMFFDDESAFVRRGFAVNERATEIYHAATLAREPDADVALMPKVYGMAIIFESRVWF